MSTKDLAKQLERRAGQCVLTCPTTALFAGMDGEERLPLGKNLRYFGDGHQISKQVDGRRYWRVPVMDGEFLVEEDTGRSAAVGGGNFLVLARSQEQAMAACEDAVEAMRRLPNVVLPFPGGYRALGLQDRLQVQGPHGIDQRRLLPHPARPGAFRN